VRNLGATRLVGNGVINSVKEFFKREATAAGAIWDSGKALETARYTNGSQAFRDAVGEVGEKGLSNWQTLKSMHLKDNGKVNWGKVAKTGAIGGAVGYGIPATVGRIASGGGLYRDSDGKFDIIGVPII